MASGLLRISLALIVFVHHLSRLGLGKACVYVFFVLSGYWVTRMWNEKYSKYTGAWRAFVLARFLRIWPLFFVMNLVAMLAMLLIGRTPDVSCADAGLVGCVHTVVGNAAILGYSLLDHPALGPAWSLDIELQFYLLAPLIILALGTRYAMVVAIAFSLLAAAWWHYVLPEALPRYLPYFLIGILTATERVVIDKKWATVSACATALVLALSLGTSIGRSVVFTGSTPGPLAAYNELLNALIGLCAAPVSVYLARQEKSRSSAALGDIAFIIYITHWIAVLIVGAYWGSLPAAQRAPYVAAAILLTTALAVVIWWLVDRPIERWRRTMLAGHHKVLKPQRVDPFMPTA